MNRLSSILIMGFFALSCLTACSVSENRVLDYDGELTISIYRACFNIKTPDPEQVKKVQDTINSYIKEQGLDFKVEIHDIALTDYASEVRIALDKNEINLLWTGTWESTIGPDKLVSDNRVYDLSDIIDGSRLFTSMDLGQWQASKYNGKNYFIPVYKDNVEGYDLVFRQDLIDKYGWDILSVSKLSDIESMIRFLF